MSTPNVHRFWEEFVGILLCKSGHRVGQYLTFDKASREVLRLRDAPTAVRAGAEFLPRVNSLNECTQGYTVEALASGGFAVRVKHEHSGAVRIRYENAEEAHP